MNTEYEAIIRVHGVTHRLIRFCEMAGTDDLTTCAKLLRGMSQRLVGREWLTELDAAAERAARSAAWNLCGAHYHIATALRLLVQLSRVPPVCVGKPLLDAATEVWAALEGCEPGISRDNASLAAGRLEADADYVGCPF